MYDYDVVLSFASEDRDYVEDIAKRLKAKKLKVFYDKFEESNLWGKDLYQYLQHVYKESAYFCIIFVSEYYLKKAWTMKVELKAAQNRAFLENREYILPLQLDPNIKLPGLYDTVGYMDAMSHTPSQIVKAVHDKVCLVKPEKDEELHRIVLTYNFVFETLDFIVNQYCCFGIKSSIIDIVLLKLIIEEYKNFLLKHAHKINSDLYIFLVQILKEIEEHIENGEFVDVTHSANLKYKTNALKQLCTAFEKSGFSKSFDFMYYISQDSKLNDRECMLKDALIDIAKEIERSIDHPVCAADYLNKIVPMRNFEAYLDGEMDDFTAESLLESELIEKIIREHIEAFDDSDSVEDDDGGDK